MSAGNEIVPVSKAALWTGRVMSTLPVLMLLFSGVMKLAQTEEVVKGFQELGWRENLAVPLGIVEIACAIIYVVPRTSVLGAILVTGYLGGAVETHVRRMELQFLIPFALGVLIWGGLYLREPRLRALIPLRR